MSQNYGLDTHVEAFRFLPWTDPADRESSFGSYTIYVDINLVQE